MGRPCCGKYYAACQHPVSPAETDTVLSKTGQRSNRPIISIRLLEKNRLRRHDVKRLEAHPTKDGSKTTQTSNISSATETRTAKSSLETVLERCRHGHVTSRGKLFQVTWSSAM